jgi:hypothetical protein
MLMQIGLDILGDEVGLVGHQRAPSTTLRVVPLPRWGRTIEAKAA